MRINAGLHRGARLEAPAGRLVRPTSDRARQAIFNILSGHAGALEGARVLDVFAGSGAMGLEALSRGAASLVLFEPAEEALRAIRRNVARCREAARVRVVRADATRPPNADGFADLAPCNLLFMDPPYGMGLIAASLTALRRAGWIAEGAVIVAERDQREPLELPTGFALRDDRRYGKARIAFIDAPGPD